MTQVTTDSIEKRLKEFNSRKKEQQDKWNVIMFVLTIISSRLKEVITRWKASQKIVSIDLGEYVLSVARTKYRGEIGGVNWYCTNSDINYSIIDRKESAIPPIEMVRDLYSKLPIIIETVDKAESCADLGISNYFA